MSPSSINRNLIIRLATLLLLVMLVVIFQEQTTGDPEHISFYAPTSSSNETHIVYMGEKELLLRVEFPESCTNWSVEFTSDLFLFPFSMFFKEAYKSEDDVVLFGCNLNPQASLGEYSIIIYFNYTNLFNTIVLNNQEYFIEHRKVFDIQISDLPTNKRTLLSIEVQLYEHCEKVEVFFYSSEDIGLDENEIIRSDLDVGYHRFKTNTYRQDVPIFKSFIGYIVKVYINDRILTHREYKVHINWTDDPLIDDSDPPLFNPIIIIIIVVLIIMINYHFLYSRKAD